MTTKLNVTNIQGQAILKAKSNIANAIALFRPTEHQEEVFLTYEKEELLELLLGGGNRAGKSLCATMIIVSAILNIPITFRDGSKHDMRPRAWRNEPLKVWIIGYDWDHLGKTIYRLLFLKGAFRIFRDRTTGKWRVWNPESPDEPKSATRFAPPLLQMSDIEGGEAGLSWENKKEHQISSCTIVHDETRIEFFPSTGAIPQGDPAHIIWVDERIEDGKWYSELLARLIDHEGRLLWTAWPDTAPSEEMSALEDRAKEQIGQPDQSSFHICLRGSDNPYTKGKKRDKIMATFDEDVRAARDDGVMNKDRWRMYARFSKYIHRAYGTDPSKDDELAKIVRAESGIPSDWTRYLILDPGSVNPGVLFVAIPPPKLGDFIVPYDELDMRNTSAKPLAEAIAAKASGTLFEEFIIDAHAARQTPMGFDGTIGSNYEKEFAAAKLTCRRRGSRFSFGSDHVEGRILKLQGALNLRAEGPRVRILGCPVLVKQLEVYRKGQDPKGNPTDAPAKHQKIDIATCLEYFVSREDCGYVAPPMVKPEDKNSRESVMKEMNRFFGRTSAKKELDRSVYCGAGEKPLF